MQPGFLELEDRHQKLNERDPLTALDKLIDRQFFRESLERLRQKERKSTVGRKPFDMVLMFKSLVLQHLYNLTDEEILEQTYTSASKRWEAMLLAQDMIKKEAAT